MGLELRKPVIFTAIGSEGLEGYAGRLVSIKGPCGEGHTMSYKAATQLRDWLSKILEGDREGTD